MIQKLQSALFVNIIFVILSIIITAVYFYGIEEKEFLFIHDEYLLLNKHEALTKIFTQNPMSLGITNTTSIVVNFFETLYYTTLYSLDLQLPFIQRLIYFLKLFLLLTLPYFGFKKLTELFAVKNNIPHFIISLWYSFNTYTLIYLHGNAFSLTLLICYSLAPYALYTYHKAIFKNNEKTSLVVTTLLFFLMSFAAYLFAAFLLFLALYTLFYTVFYKINIKPVLIRLLFQVTLFLPFLGLLFLIPYDMIFAAVNTTNVQGGETFTTLKGGLLYPLLMWFSWGIYHVWEPRNIFTFSNYFYSFPSIIAPFVIYTLILRGVFVKKKPPVLFLFMLLFLIFLFFIKASQNPFGDIYLWLVNNVPLFRVFRSPDNKFGFVLILLLCVMLIQVAHLYKKKVFILSVGIVIIIQGYLIVNGIAVKGENKLLSSDRVVKIPDEYYKVSQYFNSNTKPYGYIMPVPSVEFGHYRLEIAKRYIGQDILPKLTHLPFLYITDDSGIASTSYQKLYEIIKRGETADLSMFPIKYFLLRSDSIYETPRETQLKQKLSTQAQKKYSDNLFDVYENSNYVPLVQAQNSTFVINNPVKYRIFLKNLKGTRNLFFHQSYNPNWELYPTTSFQTRACPNPIEHKKYKVTQCQTNPKLFEPDELNLLFTNPLFAATHKIGKGYANSWEISENYIKKNIDKKYYSINPDGSLNIELILYFKTQSILYTGLIISGLYFIILTIYLLIYTTTNKFKKR